MSRLREPKKQKIDPITITITINERIECSGCRSDIYPAVNDYFIVDCGNQHSLCTKCFAIKVKEKGCDQNCYDNTNFTEDQCCGTEICDSCVDKNKICDGCNLLSCQDGQLTLDEASGTHFCQNCTNTKSSANDNKSEGDEDSVTTGNPRKRKT